MSTATQVDIERIVREVIAQLGVSSQPANAPAPAAPAAPLAVSPSHEGELSINCRVVTLESIAGRLNGAKRVRVAPGALVTPSVRDELRRRGVELMQDSAAKKADQKLAPVLLIAGRTGHDPAAAVEMLRQAGIDVRNESSDCLIKATRMLTEAADRSLGILWTRHTAIGLCLANRHTNLRAVMAAGVAATSAAVAAVGANVLVIDPTIGTLYEKRQVLREFCLGGIRACPEALKEILELRT